MKILGHPNNKNPSVHMIRKRFIKMFSNRLTHIRQRVKFAHTTPEAVSE